MTTNDEQRAAFIINYCSRFPLRQLQQQNGVFYKETQEHYETWQAAIAALAHERGKGGCDNKLPSGVIHYCGDTCGECDSLPESRGDAMDALQAETERLGLYPWQHESGEVERAIEAARLFVIDHPWHAFAPKLLAVLSDAKAALAKPKVSDAIAEIFDRIDTWDCSAGADYISKSGVKTIVSRALFKAGIIAGDVE